MPRSPRRIVTGHDATGKSVVAIDTELKPALEKPEIGVAFFEIWNTSGSPARVDNGPDPTQGRRLQIEPPKHGTIIRYVDFGPRPANPPVVTAEMARAAFAEVGSAHASSWRADALHPLMHRTHTVDYGIVLEGEITLVLTDRKVALKTGDVVVQRGTDHAWENHTDRPARMAFILVDGSFAPELQAVLPK